MALYLLTRADFGYDEYDAKLIRAENEAKARDLANEETGDEGSLWDRDEVKCEEISPEGEPRVVLVSFNAG